MFVCAYLVFVLTWFSVSSGMICSQEELGEEVTLDCVSESEQYCCNFNGKISCCSYDEYNVEQNGPGVITKILTGIAIAAFIAVILAWGLFRFRRRQQQQQQIL